MVPWRGRPVRIEHQWVGEGERALVFLHEGLGSRAMWRDFPRKLSAALGMRGLVYSRPGYGQSTPRAADERWEPDFMHRQAHEVLPALLDTLELREPVWLFGHSDGASIALLFAARFPERVAGVVAAAPHIFVEDVSVESIERTRLAYLETDLRGKLARYHDDVDSAFWGWNDIWLDPPFRDWSIEREIEAIRAPLLAMQGVDDEYGTMEQIRGIQRRVPHAKILELRDCGHSPHRDQPEAVIRAAVDFARSR
ncbi:MAG: alpha/beta hydrolase [Burkholderiales bacterium]|nr:alpha/beta hydrolase [Burkholderiales bacterium]